MNRSAKYYVLVAIGLSVATSSIAAARDFDTQNVRLADRNFEIPTRYLDAVGQIPGWLRWLPNLDKGSREVLLMIDASDVAKAVPAYKTHNGRFRDDLQLRLVVLSGNERRRYTNTMQFTDIWTASGSYRDETIERSPITGIVRAYRKIEYPNSWEVFSASPKLPHIPTDIFSFWLGHCLSARSPLTSSGKIENCDSYALAGDVAIHFKTSGQNIRIVPQIRKYLVELVSRWQRAPSAQ